VDHAGPAAPGAPRRLVSGVMPFDTAFLRRGVAVGRVALVCGAIVAAAAIAIACAGTIPPPGGPIRKEAAIILSFSPETSAVNVHPHAAVIQFDEVVSERGTGSGSSGLAALFLISPRTGDPDVAWHRSRIAVRPKHGFRPNTVYTITMLPGLSDLHNNIRRNGAVLTFSTGPTIPTTVVRGRVFDWMTGQVAPRAFVQAILRSDTSIVYVTVADSNGTFVLRHLPADNYVVRGFVDANNNRILDRIEIWDSAGVTLADSAQVELLAFLHDTLGPRVSEVLVSDSTTVRVTFDRGIDTSLAITPDLFTIKTKDSTVVPITTARSGPAYDSVVAAAIRLRTDSALHVDSIRRVDSGLASRDTAAARERRARLAERRDSAAHARLAKPSRRSPIKEVVIQVGTPLEPGKYYRIETNGVRGLLGKAHEGDRVFSGPKPPVSDSAKRSKADSVRAKARGRPGKAPPPGTVAPPTPSTTPPPATPPPTPPPAPADTSPRASPPSRSRSR
jgi:mRNA-degrading endonuclease toxin of MazEF toxin-antitoxin module